MPRRRRHPISSDGHPNAAPSVGASEEAPVSTAGKGAVNGSTISTTSQIAQIRDTIAVA